MIGTDMCPCEQDNNHIHCYDLKSHFFFFYLTPDDVWKILLGRNTLCVGQSK